MEFNNEGQTADSDIVEAAATLMYISQQITELKLLFEKQLTKTDASRHQCKLTLPMASVEDYIIPNLRPQQNATMMNDSTLDLRIHDIENGENHIFVLSSRNSGKSYVLTTGWIDYLKQRGLRPNDVVRFWWDDIRGRFCITSRHHSDIVKVRTSAAGSCS
jgi:hypothetical protein